MLSKRNRLVTLTIIYWLLNVFLHLEFSLLITTPFQLPFFITDSPIRITDYAMPISIITGVLSLIVLSKKLPAIQCPKFIFTQLTIWVSVMLMINYFLLTTPVEYIHYLQYGILGWLICHCIGSLEKASSLLLFILISTIASVIDESLQYLAITSKYSFYLDFNDFVLNFWATTLGLIIYLVFQPSPPLAQLKQSIEKPLIYFSLLLWLSYIIALASPWVSFFPENQITPGGIMCLADTCTLYLQRSPEMMGSWHDKFVGGKFYILHWWQGVILMTLIALYTFALHRRYLSKVEASKIANKNAS